MYVFLYVLLVIIVPPRINKQNLKTVMPKITVVTSTLKNNRIKITARPCKIFRYTRENSVTEIFNSLFLRDHQLARPMDLYNKIH